MFKARPPVDEAASTWIDESLGWFRRVIGEAPLCRRVAIPGTDFLPLGYRGSRDEVDAVLAEIFDHLEMDPARVEIDNPGQAEAERADLPDSFSPDLDRHRGGVPCHQHYKGKMLVQVPEAQVERPVELVITVGHDLCHDLLTDVAPDSGGRPDYERLTHLLTVYLGLGVFTANTARRFSFLSEPEIGYALARYAQLRGEMRPVWTAHLNVNPRTYLRQSLRYLQRH